MNFQIFKKAVATQFEHMKKHPLFRVKVEKDALWDTYINSFPQGSNPIYRERTEHDCNYCKQFIRAIGNVVAVIDNKVVSVWDVSLTKEPAYQVVANAMQNLVESAEIGDIFFHYDAEAGRDKSFEELESGQKTWGHFHVNLPREYVKDEDDIASALSGPRAIHDVMLRGLRELTVESMETVLDLIAQNSLYRGEEKKRSVETFLKLKKEFAKLSTVTEQDIFVWKRVGTVHESVAKIRNDVVGTMLIALSGEPERTVNGESIPAVAPLDLEVAVKKFEDKMSGTNYKRTTALFTPKMKEAAKKQVAEMGLTTALQRRHAVKSDLNINDILFADHAARKAIAGDAFDELGATASVVPKLDKIEEVSIERFLKEILPRVTSLEAYFENRHASNLVSLLTAEDPTAGQLFRWPNHFNWIYNGNVADSIAERVKAQGGTIDATMRVSLAWTNSDDLDIHVIEPDGHEISFSNKGHRSRNTGMLDVDMNAYGPHSDTEPVENVVWSKPMDGKYQVIVHNYNKRTNDRPGYTLQVVDASGMCEFQSTSSPKSGAAKTALVLTVKNGCIAKIEAAEGIAGGNSKAQEAWGLTTQNFQRVNVVTLSPNHWGDQRGVGNKHYFFMLEGCVNDDQPRGFLNEHLREELNVHRKVFEALGSMLKVESSPEQLSGLGFSSTQRNSLICRVKGSFTRTIKVVF